MIDIGLSIHPVFPFWIIIAVVITLLALMMWKEWQRKLKYLYARIAAVIFLSGSILGLLLQPAVERGRESDGVVLLTPHYKRSIADSLLKANSKLTVVRTADAIPYGDASVLDNLDDLYQDIDLHFVLGDGLPEYMVREIKRPFQFYKGELPIGIVKWQTPKSFKPNLVHKIHGTLRSSGAAQIKLIGPGGLEDSVSFSQQGNHDFALSLTPKQTGLFLYAVVIEDDGKSVTQKFPVEVKEEKKLSILFLQSFPTAEAKYLKNFLIEMNHAVVVRSKISRDKFRYEYANKQSLQIDLLSSDILNEFDLLFMDQESLSLLSGREKVALEQSIKNGLGLLIFYHSKERLTNSSMLTLNMKDGKSDTVRLTWGSSAYTFSTWPVVVTDITESVTQMNNRILSGFVNKGAGRIAFQLLQETYRLVLEGKKMEYASLWSPLVERAARADNQQFKIEMEQCFPIYPDEQLDVQVIAAHDIIPRLSSDHILIPLREDVVIDGYWHGRAWASKVGWHQFAIEQDSSYQNYYVSNPTEWQSLRRSQLHKINEAMSHTDLNDIRDKSMGKEHQPVSMLYFFIIFLLSAGFLWLVPKL